MKIKELIFVVFVACFHTLTANDIAFTIGLTKTSDANEDLKIFEQVQIGQMEQQVEITPVTTVEIICDCDDDSCAMKPEPQIESKPVPALW